MSRRESVNLFFRLRQSQKQDILKRMGLKPANSFDEYKERLKEITDWNNFAAEVLKEKAIT